MALPPAGVRGRAVHAVGNDGRCRLRVPALFARPGKELCHLPPKGLSCVCFLVEAALVQSRTLSTSTKVFLFFFSFLAVGFLVAVRSARPGKDFSSTSANELCFCTLLFGFGFWCRYSSARSGGDSVDQRQGSLFFLPFFAFEFWCRYKSARSGGGNVDQCQTTLFFTLPCVWFWCRYVL